MKDFLSESRIWSQAKPGQGSVLGALTGAVVIECFSSVPSKISIHIAR